MRMAPDQSVGWAKHFTKDTTRTLRRVHEPRNNAKLVGDHGNQLGKFSYPMVQR